MSKKLQRKHLTTPNEEWQQAYVDGKLKPHKRSLSIRLWTAFENILDKIMHPRQISTTEDLFFCLGQLLDIDQPGLDSAVIGCGPAPEIVKDLALRGYSVTGIEPVSASFQSAKKYLEGTGALIVQGTAEDIGLENGSQSFVLMENVLEHVDSVSASLSEALRITAPGGVLYIRTTNRQRFSLTGINWEFKPRFYHYFPALVKESYVYDHLHHRPQIANYSPRPAVHWFTFAELCRLGRDAGFARFYSPYDLLYRDKTESIDSRIYRLKHTLHRNPWLRAIAVSQMVGDIFMWKRNI